MAALVLAPVLGCGGKTTEDSEQATSSGADDSTPTEDGEQDEASEADPDQDQAEAKDQKPRERATTVNAAKVFRGDLVIPVFAEGTIRARNRAAVRTEIAGRILSLDVEEGQRIRKGQKIAELDGREYRIAAEEAHARYLNALGALSVEKEELASGTDENELEAKVLELARKEQRGEITRQQRRALELDLGIDAMRSGSFRRELIEARTGLSQARADEERAELNLERTILRAPFDGVVSNLTLTAGHTLTAGETICTLVDNVHVEADVGVLESELGGLEVGRPALLVFPALEETLRAQVDVIDPEIDSESRTCRVLMRVRSKDGRVRPGMFVRATIVGKIYENKLLVPNEAVLTRDGRPVVFRVDDGRAKWVYLELGLRNDQFSEVERILQGGPLEENTLVVVSDHLTLTHEAKLKVRRVVDRRVAWSTPDATQSE